MSETSSFPCEYRQRDTPTQFFFLWILREDLCWRISANNCLYISEVFHADRISCHCKCAFTYVNQRGDQFISLTLWWRRSLSYINQSIYFQSKSMGWFLYDRDLRHGRIKSYVALSHARCEFLVTEAYFWFCQISMMEKWFFCKMLCDGVFFAKTVHGYFRKKLHHRYLIEF